MVDRARTAHALLRGAGIAGAAAALAACHLVFSFTSEELPARDGGAEATASADALPPVPDLASDLAAPRDASPDAAPGCAPGFADCDGLADTGCETELAADPAHCGRCDHGCLGGQCVGGACQPHILSAAEVNPLGIAAAVQHVYWVDQGASLNEGAVRRCELATGAVDTLAASQPGPVEIAIVQGFAYWSAYKDVRRVPVTGGSPQVVATSPGRPWAIAVGGAFVYWTSISTGQVLSAPLAGGAVVEVHASAGTVFDVALGGAEIFWSNYSANAILRSAGPGAEAIVVASLPGPSRVRNVALAGAWVYWTDDGGAPQPAPSAGGVWRAPTSGGTPEPLVTAHPQASGLAVDSAYAYWSEPGAVWRAPLAGGSPERLVPGLSDPKHIAVDDKALYWTDFGSGTVGVLAK